MKTKPFQDAESLLLELFSISGVSAREGEVMGYICQQLLAAGADRKAIRFDQAHRRTPFDGEVGNLVFQLPGTLPGERRLFVAHVDTVPICQGARPVCRGPWIVPADRHTGLGADNRSGVAVTLHTALEILRRRQPHPPLTFLWTVQEELGLYGARYAALGLLGRPRMAFNFDGGAPNKIGIGATGGYKMSIRVRGIASHAGVSPEKGVSAITVAAAAITRLQREGWHGRIEKDGQFGTSNMGVIHGGQATNVVAPEVEIRAEARSHQPAFRRRIIRAIEQAFREAARELPNIEGKTAKLRIVGHLDYEAFRLKDDAPVIAEAEAAIRAAELEPERGISNGGLDANWLTARGIPTVTLGAGQFRPHTTAERLHRGQFRKACEIAMALALGSRRAES